MIRIPRIRTHILLVYISIICGLIYQITSQVYLFKQLSLLSGTLGILLYFVTKKKNRLLSGWAIFAAYLLLIGFIQALPSWPSSSYNFIRTDLSTIMFVAIGIILDDSDCDEEREYIFRIILIISVACGFYALFHFRGTLSQLIYRYNGLNTDNYILWGVTCQCYAYAGYKAFLFKKDRILGISVVVLYSVLGILFQKRSVVINSIVLLMLFSFLYIKNSESRETVARIRNVILIVVIIFVAVIILYQRVPLIHQMIDQTFERISEIDFENNGGSYDRQREANYYVENSKWYQFIFGYGIGNYLTSTSWGIYTGMHIGLYNLIYKGGILYLIIWIFVLFKTLRAISKLKYLDRYSLMCVCITTSALISLFFEYSWSETIIKVCYVPFIAHVCRIDTNNDYYVNENIVK